MTDHLLTKSMSTEKIEHMAKCMFWADDEDYSLCTDGSFMDRYRILAIAALAALDGREPEECMDIRPDFYKLQAA